jgi:hypothetical protein
LAQGSNEINWLRICGRARYVLSRCRRYLFFQQKMTTDSVTGSVPVLSQIRAWRLISQPPAQNSREFRYAP